MGFILGKVWFNNQKLINKTHYYNKLNKKSHMIISIEAEKAFDKVQSLFTIKTPRKSEIKENFLISTMLKSFITLNRERLNIFP